VLVSEGITEDRAGTSKTSSNVRAVGRSGSSMHHSTMARRMVAAALICLLFPYQWPSRGVC